MMADDAARLLKGPPSDTADLIMALLEIGFKHGADWKSSEVQPLVCRYDGIDISPDPTVNRLN